MAKKNYETPSIEMLDLKSDVVCSSSSLYDPMAKFDSWQDDIY